VELINKLRQFFKKEDKPSLKTKPSQYTLSDIRVQKAVDKYLQKLWEDMQDCYADDKLRFDGAINLALGLGIFNKEKYELWNLRVEKCPEPDHPGRSWCAYCGDVELEEDECED